jgi:uncharacterized membrane protein YuzA (DUF378 family)
MTRVSERVQVEVPVRTAYDRWTQFEEFPSFMQSVRSVEQLDDHNLRWTVDAAGRAVSFETEITEQSTSGPMHAGAVDFHRLGDTTTEIAVEIDVDETGVPGVAAAERTVLERRMRHDLERFRQLAEQRVAEAGWRGEIRPAGSGEGMTAIDKVATGLVSVGALNAGLAAATGRDLVSRLVDRGVASRPSLATRIVLGLVGAAGAYSLARFARLAARRKRSAT